MTLSRPFLFKYTAALIALAVAVTSILPAYSASPVYLPASDKLLGLSQTFDQPFLRGIKLYSDQPFKLDFIIDYGSRRYSELELKSFASRQISYFLAALTIPDSDLWVNLSPFEPESICPQKLSHTQMGADMLAQDYFLKQLAASLTYPENDLGKTFWSKVYRAAYQKYGTTKIPVDTFNKVWIVPDEAVVYEDAQTAVVGESRLKVMMEQDYVAKRMTNAQMTNDEKTREISAGILREVIVPVIAKEVNSGKNFTQLRQMYQALILANWFKAKLRQSAVAQLAADKNKTKGLGTEDLQAKEKIYRQYLAAYTKGVYNYVKKEYDSLSRKTIKRQYYSGGIDFRLAKSSSSMMMPVAGKSGELAAGVLGLTKPALPLILAIKTHLAEVEKYLSGAYVAQTQLAAQTTRGLVPLIASSAMNALQETLPPPVQRFYTKQFLNAIAVWHDQAAIKKLKDYLTGDGGVELGSLDTLGGILPVPVQEIKTKLTRILFRRLGDTVIFLDIVLKKDIDNFASRNRYGNNKLRAIAASTIDPASSNIIERRPGIISDAEADWGMKSFDPEQVENAMVKLIIIGNHDNLFRDFHNLVFTPLERADHLSDVQGVIAVMKAYHVGSEGYSLADFLQDLLLLDEQSNYDAAVMAKAMAIKCSVPPGQAYDKLQAFLSRWIEEWRYSVRRLQVLTQKTFESAGPDADALRLVYYAVNDARFRDLLRSQFEAWAQLQTDKDLVALYYERLRECHPADIPFTSAPVERIISSAMKPDAVPGGIDLNSQNLKLDIKGNGLVVVPALTGLPFDPDEFAGFSFEIIEIIEDN